MSLKGKCRGNFNREIVEQYFTVSHLGYVRLALFRNTYNNDKEKPS